MYQIYDLQLILLPRGPLTRGMPRSSAIAIGSGLQNGANPLKVMQGSEFPDEIAYLPSARYRGNKRRLLPDSWGPEHLGV